MKYLAVICMVLVCGCSEERLRHIENEMARVNNHIGLVAVAVEEVDETGGEVRDTVNVLAAANAASAPFNPYAGIIAAGLGGLSLFLEGQRRKEKSERKNAEAKLNK
jgi:hypothetical protein